MALKPNLVYEHWVSLHDKTSLDIYRGTLCEDQYINPSLMLRYAISYEDILTPGPNEEKEEDEIPFGDMEEFVEPSEGEEEQPSSSQ